MTDDVIERVDEGIDDPYYRDGIAKGLEMAAEAVQAVELEIKDTELLPTFIRLRSLFIHEIRALMEKHDD